MFYCEISEIFKNNFFAEHLRTTTPKEIVFWLNESSMILNYSKTLRDLRLLILVKEVCSEPYSKSAQTFGLCRLYERPESLLKTDSITAFKNIFQATYKDTRTILTIYLFPFI